MHGFTPCASKRLLKPMHGASWTKDGVKLPAAAQQQQLTACPASIPWFSHIGKKGKKYPYALYHLLTICKKEDRKKRKEGNTRQN